MINCKICGETTQEFDTATILGKYNARYYHCSQCGFVQTEEPYWLEEAYSSALASGDTGVMLRNVQNAANLLFLMKFIEDGLCLDFGGAYGVLTRMMRDNGFDFYSYDKYAQNLYAGGFSGELTGRYTLVTSFENFEHFVNPMEEIEKILNITQTIFFTTLLLPSTPPPPPQDWWYYGLSTGQHIAFYSKKTLEYIANKYGMRFITNDINTHILSKVKIPENIFKQLNLYNRINNRINISKYFKRPTKIYEDIEKILGNK